MFKRKEEDYKLGQEAAESQLDSFMEFYDIPVDETEMDEDEYRAVVGTYNKLIRAIRLGYLEITTEGGDIKVVQYLKHPLPALGDSIEYGKISGAAKSAMKSRKGEDYHGKIFALMATLCNKSAGIMETLIGSDSSTMEAIGILFLKM
jgi:hypothetical protein